MRNPSQLQLLKRPSPIVNLTAEMLIIPTRMAIMAPMAPLPQPAASLQFSTTTLPTATMRHPALARPPSLSIILMMQAYYSPYQHKAPSMAVMAAICYPAYQRLRFLQELQQSEAKRSCFSAPFVFRPSRRSTTGCAMNDLFTYLVSIPGYAECLSPKTSHILFGASIIASRNASSVARRRQQMNTSKRTSFSRAQNVPCQSEPLLAKTTYGSTCTNSTAAGNGKGGSLTSNSYSIGKKSLRACAVSASSRHIAGTRESST